MEYVTAKEAAKRWSVNVRVVQDYCKAGRIDGALKHGTVWMIPLNAKKPQDPRKSKKPAHPQLFPKLLLLQDLRFDGRSPEELAAELPNEAYRKQFWLEYAFFTADAVSPLSVPAEEAQDGFFLLNHLFLQILLHIRNGDYLAFERGMKRLDELEDKYNDHPAERINIELAKASISASLYDPDSCPEWLKSANFSMFPADTKSFVLYIYVRYLHATGQFVRILGVTEAALALSDGPGFTITELYLMIISASVLLSLGEKERARAMLQKAVSFVHPYRLYIPFMENITMLRGELDGMLKESYPDDYKLLMTGWKKVMAGWTVVHNQLLNDNVPLLLTLRELQIGLYLVEGLSYKDIAEHMGLSLSTVNNYLQNIRSKLGVKTSAEVVEYMRWA